MYTLCVSRYMHTYIHSACVYILYTSPSGVALRVRPQFHQVKIPGLTSKIIKKYQKHTSSIPPRWRLKLRLKPKKLSIETSNIAKSQGYKVYGANEFAVPRAETKNNINTLLYTKRYIHMIFYIIIYNFRFVA